MSYPPSSNLLDHYLYTNEDKTKCLCRGSGVLQVMIAPSWVTVTAKWEDKTPVDYSVSYMSYGCIWHNSQARDQISYPDGWTTDVLTKWCKKKNVPLPAWIERCKSQPYTQMSWDGSKFTTYGKFSYSALEKTYQETSYGSIEPNIIIGSPNTKKMPDNVFGQSPLWNLIKDAK